jgi:hypothetical protein
METKKIQIKLATTFNNNEQQDAKNNAETRPNGHGRLGRLL